MNVSEFIDKWKSVELTERSASQQHFLDLCELLEHPKPAEADPKGEWFTFEKGAEKHGGGEGWADVWKKGFFGWEYKGKLKDLNAAYDQLLQYREALQSPPLLVVCDMDRIVVHTNFTATVKQVYEIPLAELATPRNLEILRHVFHQPEKLKPGTTSEAMTTEAASRLAEIAQSLRSRGLDSREVARFLDRLVFCLFAEDVGLLPENLFTRILDRTGKEPARLKKALAQLFDAMAEGGDFGELAIRHFNGDLFTAGPVLELTPEEIQRIRDAAALEWSAIDPSIFGTLFERGLDPDKRSQLGAHYTSRDDIETLIEPVIMAPLRREWAVIQQTVENLLKTGKKAAQTPSEAGRPGRKGSPSKATMRKARDEAHRIVQRFLEDLSRLKVLDPACGSGNFLYVTLQKLKDLEKEVILFAMKQGLGGFLPMVGPWQLYGIEINPYAFELAQMTVWIGYLQWVRANGFGVESDPILRPMNTFKCMDAILACSSPIQGASGTPDKSGYYEPEWPEVDFIVSNPPFLGDKLMRGQLGDDYVERLRALYAGRIPGQSDLCCYWFEKARKHIAGGKCRRAGLLATQGIRGGANREVLKRIKETGDIFWAISDRDWVLDGANVHVSVVAFDGGKEETRSLNGQPVATINANLSGAADITQAKSLRQNQGLGFLGSCKGGDFDIDPSEARQVLQTGGNPHGKPNSDVVRPVLNSEDLIKSRAQRWIVDFADLRLETASRYQSPMGLVHCRVRPARDKNRDKWLKENWWRPQRMRPEMRASVARLERFLVTTTTSKHRIFVWLHPPELPDHQLIVFARSDDYFFGVLHSRLHELWARAQGTQLRERESGFRYTPTTCFETFPLPEGRGVSQYAPTISEAAKELDDLRNRWLNPAEWVKEEVLEFPGSVDGPWARYVHDPDSRGIGTVRYPRLVPKDPECAGELAKRTLTKLYNERPTWLDLAHKKLDAAVFAAYGWDPSLSDEAILEKLLALNLERSAAQ
jgi:type II restriction/modification system DNA methylase subunit YeeA